MHLFYKLYLLKTLGPTTLNARFKKKYIIIMQNNISDQDRKTVMEQGKRFYSQSPLQGLSPRKGKDSSTSEYKQTDCMMAIKLILSKQE